MPPAKSVMRRPAASWRRSASAKRLSPNRGRGRRQGVPAPNLLSSGLADENRATKSANPRTGGALSATRDGDPRQNSLFARRDVHHLSLQRAGRPGPRPVEPRARERADAAVSLAAGRDRHRGKHLPSGDAPPRASALAGNRYHGLPL